MIIKPISQAEMLERVRQNNNRRHPLYQIPAPKTEEGIKLAKKVQKQPLWESVIPRVMRKMKWKPLI